MYGSQMDRFVNPSHPFLRLGEFYLRTVYERLQASKA